MVHLLLVIVAVGKDRTQQRIRVRIAGVGGGGAIRTKEVRTGRVVSRVDADIARHQLDIDTGLHGVLALNPGGLIRDGLHRIGAHKRPAAILPKGRSAANALAGRLGREPGGKAKVHLRQQVQHVTIFENAWQLNGLAVGTLQRQLVIGVSLGAAGGGGSHRVNRIHALLASVNAPGRLVDQGWGNGVNNCAHRSGRRHIVTMRVLAPHAARRADRAGVAVHGLVILN